jgi:hypothetical protein
MANLAVDFEKELETMYSQMAKRFGTPGQYRQD